MLYKDQQELTIEDCIRATAEKAKNHDGRYLFHCKGLSCNKCPFQGHCTDSMYFYTVKDWIEILQENNVVIDPAVVAEYCNSTTDTVESNSTVLTQTIDYLAKQLKYIEETIEDEELRGNNSKYLVKASAHISNTVRCLNHADILLRKQRGDQLQ